jgi:hypothetical protein
MVPRWPQFPQQRFLQPSFPAQAAESIPNSMLLVGAAVRWEAGLDFLAVPKDNLRMGGKAVVFGDAHAKPKRKHHPLGLLSFSGPWQRWDHVDFQDSFAVQ